MLVSGLFARPAEAAGLPRLTVHRTDDTLDCPDARALAALVATQMKRPALEPVDGPRRGSERGLDIQIYRSGEGFTAVIQAGGKTRKLSDQGTTCSSLAVALALSISVLLDMVILPAEPEPAPAPAPPAPPLLREPVPLPDTTPVPPEPEARRFHVSLMAAPVVTLGFLQTWAGGFTSEIDFRIHRFSVAGGILVLPGVNDLNLISGLVRGCGAAADKESLRLAVCLETYAGAIQGTNIAPIPWVATGTGVLFEQRIWGPMSWGARAGLEFPLVRGDNGGVFSPPPVAGAWDAELRVSIW